MTNYNKTGSERGEDSIGRTLRPDAPTRGTASCEDADKAMTAAQPVMATGGSVCPNCGAELDSDADYCESCHCYIRKDVCSFCGAHLDEEAAFCPECGNSREGIVCPVCHTINSFSFCKQCGAALTEEARRLQRELSMNPDYSDMKELVANLVSLDNILPYSSQRDAVKDEFTGHLRRRVLKLLAEDRGEENPVVEKKPSRRMTAAELEERKADVMARLQESLERLARKPIASPVKARNYFMASKPAGVRLVWMCNYKNAMHSSPCGCAKPQLGGKWIVLGRGGAEQIKDDN